jgi:hypothetical protein
MFKRDVGRKSGLKDYQCAIGAHYISYLQFNLDSYKLLTDIIMNINTLVKLKENYANRNF